jgi:hypothetical protein
MKRPTTPLNSQLNLLLVNAAEAAVPDDNQGELILALVELLISAALGSATPQTNGGRDEQPEVDH